MGLLSSICGEDIAGVGSSLQENLHPLTRVANVTAIKE
jgi:hypothetical protein